MTSKEDKIIWMQISLFILTTTIIIASGKALSKKIDELKTK